MRLFAVIALAFVAGLRPAASESGVLYSLDGVQLHVDLPTASASKGILIHGTLCREGADAISRKIEIAIAKVDSDAEPATVTLAPMRERDVQCRFFSARSSWTFAPGDSLQLCVTDKSRVGMHPRCELVHAS